MIDPKRQEPPVHPPSTQEEVIASALASLGRFAGVARRAAERAMQGDGPAADAARTVRDAARGVFDAARQRIDQSKDASKD